MSFENEGFSGHAEGLLREKQADDYRELFAFAYKCSTHAVGITQLLSKYKDKTLVTACLFFARSTSHFQAAICLAEGGMTIEAMVLSRSLLETFFVLNALAEEAVTPAELLSNDYAARKTHANVFLNGKNKYENVAPFETKLREFVADKADSIAISIFEFAAKGNASAAYDGVYRHLSHNAAHPSISAVEPYLVETQGRNHARFKPVLEYTPRAVISACLGVLLSCFACDKLGIRTPDTHKTGSQLWEEYETLEDARSPWQ
jgi:hypothetical protein